MQILKNKVLIQEIKSEEVTKSGIILDSEKKQVISGRTGQATVIEVGPDVTDVQVGQKVLYKHWAPTKYEQDKQEFLLIHQEDILAILENVETSETA